MFWHFLFTWTWQPCSSFQMWMCVWGRIKHPGMLSVWGCHILVTKGRTLKIRLRMNIVLQMCSVLLLIACCGCIVSLYWAGRFLWFVSNMFCTSFTSALNFRFDLILGGEDEVNCCVLLRTSDLQHCAQSCFYFAYFIDVICSCRSYWWSAFSIGSLHAFWTYA